MLTPQTCEIICAYEINVNYVNTKTLDEENNMSLNFPSNIVDQVGNITDLQAEGGRQTHTFYMNSDLEL